jgi:hypothetical protein
MDDRRGFVLIAAAAAVLIGAIWAVSASNRISASLTIGSVLEAQGSAAIEAQKSLAEATFLLTTSPRQPCGLVPDMPYVDNEFMAGPPPPDLACLPLDGRPQKFGANSVEFQDAAGLISVRIVDPAIVDAFVGRRAQQPATFTFGGALADYADRNDDVRSDGAEIDSYRAAGRKAGPSNRWPRTPFEAADALGWSSVEDPSVFDALGVGVGQSINVNSASAGVIAAHSPWLDEDGAAIVEARQTAPISSVEEIARLATNRMPSNPFTIGYGPGPTTRVRIYRRDGAALTEVSLTTYGQKGRPLWSLDYVLTAPHTPVHGQDVQRDDGGVSAADADRDRAWISSSR